MFISNSPSSVDWECCQRHHQKTTFNNFALFYLLKMRFLYLPLKLFLKVIHFHFFQFKKHWNFELDIYTWESDWLDPKVQVPCLEKVLYNQLFLTLLPNLFELLFTYPLKNASFVVSSSGLAGSLMKRSSLEPYVYPPVRKLVSNFESLKVFFLEGSPLEFWIDYK